MSFLEAYRAHVAERGALGIPPLPLSAKQTEALIALLRDPPKGEEAFLVFGPTGGELDNDSGHFSPP